MGGDLVEAALREVRVAVGLRVVVAADAGVGHHRGAAARLYRVVGVAVAARAVAQRAVEGVVAGVLVAEFVRDEVDRPDVARGRVDTGAAASLAVQADGAQLCDAAAVATQRKVANVEVARACQQAGNDAVAVEAAAAAAGHLCCAEAGRAATGPVGAGGLGDGVQVQRVGGGDQHHADRQVVFIDLVHARHQRDLGGRDVGCTVEGGVGRVGDQREPVRAQLGADGGVQRHALWHDLVVGGDAGLAVAGGQLVAASAQPRVGREAGRQRAVGGCGSEQRLAHGAFTRQPYRDGDLRVRREAHAHHLHRVGGTEAPALQRQLRLQHRRFGERCDAVGHVGAPVAGVQTLVGLGVGFEIPVALARTHRSVHAELRGADAQRGSRVVDAATGIRLDVRVLGGQAGLHHGRLDHREALPAAGWVRQCDDHRAGACGAAALKRCLRHRCAEAGTVQRQGAVAGGLYQSLGAGHRGALRWHRGVAPERRRGVAGGGAAGRQGGLRRGDVGAAKAGYQHGDGTGQDTAAQNALD